MSGIRAEIKIDSQLDCPITKVTEATGAPATSVTKAKATEPDATITEEFILGTDESLDSVVVDEPDDELHEIFSYGSQRAYRFNRSQDHGCPCDAIEQLDCPILDVYSRDGVLTIVFHAPDLDALKAVLSELNERWPGVSVHRLLHSDDDRDDQNLVLVDQSRLTDRQQEVLETAHEMGYFEHPKGANAGEVAEELDINASTFTEHLAAAQRKILGTLLSD